MLLRLVLAAVTVSLALALGFDGADAQEGEFFDGLEPNDCALWNLFLDYSKIGGFARELSVERTRGSGAGSVTAQFWEESRCPPKPEDAGTSEPDVQPSNFFGKYDPESARDTVREFSERLALTLDYRNVTLLVSQSEDRIQQATRDAPDPEVAELKSEARGAVEFNNALLSARDALLDLRTDVMENLRGVLVSLTVSQDQDSLAKAPLPMSEPEPGDFRRALGLSDSALGLTLRTVAFRREVFDMLGGQQRANMHYVQFANTSPDKGHNPDRERAISAMLASRRVVYCNADPNANPRCVSMDPAEILSTASLRRRDARDQLERFINEAEVINQAIGQSYNVLQDNIQQRLDDLDTKLRGNCAKFDEIGNRLARQEQRFGQVGGAQSNTVDAKDVRALRSWYDSVTCGSRIKNRTQEHGRSVRGGSSKESIQLDRMAYSFEQSEDFRPSEVRGKRERIVELVCRAARRVRDDLQQQADLSEGQICGAPLIAYSAPVLNDPFRGDDDVLRIHALGVAHVVAPSCDATVGLAAMTGTLDIEALCSEPVKAPQREYRDPTEEKRKLLSETEATAPEPLPFVPTKIEPTPIVDLPIDTPKPPVIASETHLLLGSGEMAAAVAASFTEAGLTEQNLAPLIESTRPSGTVRPRQVARLPEHVRDAFVPVGREDCAAAGKSFETLLEKAVGQISLELPSTELRFFGISADDTIGLCERRSGGKWIHQPTPLPGYVLVDLTKLERVSQ